MTIDPYEWTVRDPLEETVPDLIVRKRRLSDGQRRVYSARDRAGHVWAALSSADAGHDPPVGVATRTVSLPERLVSSVVLEARPGVLIRKGTGPVQVLRFAH